MSFHSLIMVFENFEFRHRFLYFDKKVGISGRLQLAHNLSKNGLKSRNMAKPLLKMFRMDQGDGFQYLSSYQNASRSKNGIR